ncbi:hypothetical protein [Streptomyces litmocidini]|uniref:hypothetical protein n=1 Tax=Streptomyces litmocidini TaxID=67318 RepID=UPI00167CB4DF|nr:hypothetical protein [Streptomyces litmocidini]
MSSAPGTSGVAPSRHVLLAVRETAKAEGAEARQTEPKRRTTAVRDELGTRGGPDRARCATARRARGPW